MLDIVYSNGEGSESTYIQLLDVFAKGFIGRSSNVQMLFVTNKLKQIEDSMT